MNFTNASNMASAAANQFNKTEGADKVDEAALGNDPNQIAAANKVVDLQRLMKGDTGGITDALGMNKDKDESAGEGMSGMIGKFTAPVQDAFKNVQSHLPAGMGGGDKDEKDNKESGFPGQAAVTNMFNSLGGGDKGDDKKDSGFPGQAAVTNMFNSLGGGDKGDDKKDSGFPGQAAVTNMFNSLGGGDNKGDDKKDSGFPGQAAVTNMFNSVGGGDNKGDDNKDSGFPGQAAVANIFGGMGGGDNKGENNNDSEGNFLSKTMDQANSLASSASDRIQGTANNVDDEVVNVSDFLTKPTFPPN